MKAGVLGVFSRKTFSTLDFGVLVWYNMDMICNVDVNLIK